MPLPSKPSLDYSYSGFQSSQGDNAFPGTELDNDLLNLKDGVGNVVDFLSSILTSEGKLKPSAVGNLPALQQALVTLTVQSELQGYPANLVQLGNAVGDAIAAAAAAANGKATKTLSNVAGVDVGSAPIKVLTSPFESTIGARLGTVIDMKNDHGCRGNNIDDDSVRLQAAVDRAEAGDYPIGIYCPGGLYRLDNVLNINKPIVFFGDTTRGATFTPRGNGGFAFVGTTARIGDCGLRNLSINGVAMGSGYAVDVDWTQGFRMENVIVAQPDNGMRLRQSGDITFCNVRFDQVRGAAGILAFGFNGPRNGENDQIDAIDFAGLSVTGQYKPGVTAPNCDAYVFDGRVHTFTGFAMRALNCNRGIYAKNTAGLPQKFAPSFFHVISYECENTYQEGVRLEWFNEFKPLSTFIAGSVSQNGLYLGPGVNTVKMFGGGIRSIWQNGVYIDGARNVDLIGTDIYDTGQAGPNAYSGVHVQTGDGIRGIGGHWGKNFSLDAYTENQKFGILNVGGGSVAVVGVDLRGNTGAGLGGEIAAYGCGGLGTPQITPMNQISSYADDTAAAAAGLPVGSVYRTGSTLKIRAA